MKTIDKILKIFVSIGFLVATYFLARWIIGDLDSTPISQFTMKDLGSLIFAGFICYIVASAVLKNLDK